VPNNDRASAEVLADAHFSLAGLKPAVRPRSRFYLPELDVLRCLAFMAIFLQHSFQKTPAYYFPDFHQDWIGRAVSILAYSGGYSVDLFFLISAFLITQLLLREQEATGTLDVRRFYLRRILRIWPLYFAYLFGAAMAGLVVAQFHITAKYLILLVLMSGNIADALWGWTPTFIVSQLWSISLEEQFYLLWPLVVRRGRTRTLVVAAFAMIAVSVVARTICWLVSAPASFVWTNTLTRLDPLAAGILLGAWGMHRQFQPTAMVRAALLAAGVATMLIMSAWCDPYWSPNSALTLFVGYPVVTLGCVAIFFAFLGMEFNLAKPTTRALAYLGKISYGLYIWHMLGLELAKKVVMLHLPWLGEWADSSIFITICALALTIAIAAASYRFLETPFLKLKSRYALIPSRPR
jgi:peptidoglycan/LPS O-acetylase OafA/YrhL